MTPTRRELLFGLGGGAAGLALTPLPWKLLDDLAIRTQHRRALPVPARGEISCKPAACALCPGSCALRVRCVGPRPVSAVGEPGHPLGDGACAIGLTLHQLAYHPLRLSAPVRRVGGRLEPIPLAAAVAGIAAAVRAAQKAGQSVMVLDRRPGRVVSQAWRELLAGVPGGIYATVAGEEGTLTAVQASLAQPTPLGIDLERTRTIVSFGAPVLDGWGRRGRMLSSRGHLRVVQLDSWRSPTAALADEWVPVAPGAEGPLALALAHAAARREPWRVSLDARAVLASFAPGEVASRVGVPAERIESLARSLVENRPTVAIGGGEPGAGPLGPEAEKAIALLNAVLGSVGREGGIVPRRPLPDATGAATGATVASPSDLPAGSVRVAILEADDGRALPWPLVARTLAPGALVVSLSPFDAGLARQASLVVPAPAPLEGYDELLPTADAAPASYALSAPILTRPAGATESPELVARLAAALGTGAALGSHVERLKRRVGAIQGVGRGRFVARQEVGYAEAPVADAGAAWDTLVQGGCWIDAAQPPAVAVGRVPLPSPEALARWRKLRPASAELILVAFACRATAGETPISPVLSKLYQESDLRASAASATVHPKTAEVLELRAGRRVWVESAAGRVLAELRFDPLLPMGQLALAAGPAPAVLHPGAGTRLLAGAVPLLEIDDDGTWRGTHVRVREA